eukprot:scaffold60993_cov57-Phaeocystis_antarctica.AAC.2
MSARPMSCVHASSVEAAVTTERTISWISVPPSSVASSVISTVFARGTATRKTCQTSGLSTLRRA